MTIEQILQAIEEMKVLELNELVKAAEEKFGVSASAPVMVAAAGDGGAAVEEKTEFDVILTEAGGIVSNINGGEYNLFEDKYLVASNGKIHNEFIKNLNL